jgi:mannan endo-1,4-beta-mannosidase
LRVAGNNPMTKTWQLRALGLYLTLGIPLAASCAREENTLEDLPNDTSDGAKGGTSSGGSSSKAGTTAKAGTQSGAFGGTSSAGSGGKTGTAGSMAAEGGAAASMAGTSAGGKAGGGSGGTAAGGGGSGGAGGGGTTVPPEVLARASAVVYYQTAHPAASDKTIQMKLHIKNQSADPLPMANVKIRYWFTAEVTPELHQYYTGPEAKSPKAAFVNDGANSHALLTFGGGSIVMGGDYNASEIQLEITNNNSAFTQTGDFSFDASASADKPNPNITLYLDDKLIWGCEPSGACFDDAAGGAGGASGAPGAGGAP